MTTTPKHTVPSVACNAQHRIDMIIENLTKMKKELGISDVIDTYEYGFVSALKMLDKIYNLDIDFGEEENK